MIAYVTYPNTPDSDAKPTVPHTVEMDDGRKEYVMAADPSEAIAKVRARDSRYKSKYCSGTNTCCCGGHLRVGDTVLWSGGWGTEPEKPAVIVGIGSKNDRVVYDLNNGHWAYEEQLRRSPALAS